MDGAWQVKAGSSEVSLRHSAEPVGRHCRPEQQFGLASGLQAAPAWLHLRAGQGRAGQGQSEQRPSVSAQPKTEPPAAHGTHGEQEGMETGSALSLPEQPPPLHHSPLVDTSESHKGGATPPPASVVGKGGQGWSATGASGVRQRQRRVAMQHARKAGRRVPGASASAS